VHRRGQLAPGLCSETKGPLQFLEPQGIGYLLLGASGLTLADLAQHSFDGGAALEVESLFVDGSVPFHVVKEALSRRVGAIDVRTFASMVVNRDWSVSDAPGVRVGRLSEGLSFRPFLLTRG
jgi:hypothetical protein